MVTGWYGTRPGGAAKMGSPIRDPSRDRRGNYKAADESQVFWPTCVTIVAIITRVFDVLVWTENLGSDIVLVMASSTRSCQSIRDYLSLADHDAPRGAKGRRMLMRSLSNYLWWKARLEQQWEESRRQQAPKAGGGGSKSAFERSSSISAALKRKDKVLADKAKNRRRTRGGAPAATSSHADIHAADEPPDEVDQILAL